MTAFPPATPGPHHTRDHTDDLLCPAARRYVWDLRLQQHLALVRGVRLGSRRPGLRRHLRVLRLPHRVLVREHVPAPCGVGSTDRNARPGSTDSHWLARSPAHCPASRTAPHQCPQPAQCRQLATAIWRCKARRRRRRRRPLIATPPSRRPCRDALLELLYPLYLKLRCAHPSPRVAHAVPLLGRRCPRARAPACGVSMIAYDVYPADHPHDGWYQRVDVLSSGS
eukprot:COSAG01_NODE_1567_length_9877_cov_8.690939_4_plen_225_part_00